MRVLIVTATSAEIAPILAVLRHTASPNRNLATYAHAGHVVDVLTTGVGMVATAAWCSRALSEVEYGLVLNVGVCGSFDRALAPGTVVHVVSDCLAELGAEDDEAFLRFQDLDLPGECEFANPAPPANAVLAALPKVRGITVNTVHGRERSIAAVMQRFNPHVESMEGAAFMYACLIHEVPFAQVRAVSNIVERRNRHAWEMADAVQNLGRTMIAILEHA